MKTFLLIAVFAAFTQAAIAQKKYPITFYFKKGMNFRVQLVDKYGNPITWDLIAPFSKDSLTALLPVGPHLLRFSIGSDIKTVVVQPINKNPWKDVMNVGYTQK